MWKVTSSFFHTNYLFFEMVFSCSSRDCWSETEGGCVWHLVFHKYKAKRILCSKEQTVLGTTEGGFQTASTGSAAAALVWKNITVNCDNELVLRISFQISAGGSLLSVTHQKFIKANDLKIPFSIFQCALQLSRSPGWRKSWRLVFSYNTWNESKCRGT